MICVLWETAAQRVCLSILSDLVKFLRQRLQYSAVWDVFFFLVLDVCAFNSPIHILIIQTCWQRKEGGSTEGIRVDSFDSSRLPADTQTHLRTRGLQCQHVNHHRPLHAHTLLTQAGLLNVCQQGKVERWTKAVTMCVCVLPWELWWSYTLSLLSPPHLSRNRGRVRCEFLLHLWSHSLSSRPSHSLTKRWDINDLFNKWSLTRFSPVCPRLVFLTGCEMEIPPFLFSHCSSRYYDIVPSDSSKGTTTTLWSFISALVVCLHIKLWYIA